MKLLTIIVLAAPLALAASSASQQGAPRPQDTEVHAPVPRVVTPGATDSAPPSDALVLFDGKSLDACVLSRDKSPARWIVADGVLTVHSGRGIGKIETKRRCRNCLLHIEWKIPEK